MAARLDGGEEVLAERRREGERGDADDEGSRRRNSPAVVEREAEQPEIGLTQLLEPPLEPTLKPGEKARRGARVRVVLVTRAGGNAPSSAQAV